ncbi:hypothetical protein LTR08_001361 [Meristemomyces frigidus]|nr:hypothetical protein LTR08_001361 [Meristemomyces frigidus]
MQHQSLFPTTLLLLVAVSPAMGVATASAGVPTATSTSASIGLSMTSTSDIAASKGLSGAVLAGITCGALVGLALLGAGVWYMRKLCFFQRRWRERYNGGAERRFDEKDGLERGGSGLHGAGALAERDAGVVHSGGVAVYWPNYLNEHQEFDSHPVNTSATPPQLIRDTVPVRDSGLGLGIVDGFYVLTNPDPPSAPGLGIVDGFYVLTNPDPPSAPAAAGNRTHLVPASLRVDDAARGRSESASEISASREKPLPASPPVSNLAAPDTPFTATTTTSTPSPNTGQASPMTPTPAYRYTHHSASCTPSIYAGEPPSSLTVARAGDRAPPSLQQEYSSVSLGIMAAGDFQGGLRMRDGDGEVGQRSGVEEAGRGGCRDGEEGVLALGGLGWF